ncbi:MAG: ABC transporter ATP-binding protein [Defluviitaleaceae bacterium]|nr:ABC transporter ATP-binding protein [Defluviitaleaceae bacterium]
MIDLKNVSKIYSNTTALSNFTIKIDKPGIYCLLGRNGAGKTTLLKTIAGHIETTEGEVSVAGKPVKPLAMPDSVHFVETAASHFNLSLEQLLKAAAAINPAFDSDFALEIAKKFNLNLRKRYRKLSFGMKAMVNTLIAMSSGKDILILDEPVLGFDPVMRKTFYDLLHESVASKPKIVIVSTHIIDEIAKVAEQLIIINHGKLLLYSDINEIDEKAYSITGPAEYVAAATEGLNVLADTKAGGFLSRYIYDKRIQESDKYSINTLSLQDFFIGLVGNEKGGF